VFENFKAKAIVTVQALFRAKPDEALLILNDIPDRTLGKSVFNRQMVEANLAGGCVGGTDRHCQRENESQQDQDAMK
jgi:hypothetical protein